MFGNIVLLSWPLIVAMLLSKKSVPVAIIAAIIAGYLLLPEQIAFDLPVLPALEKDTIPTLSLLLLLGLGLGQARAKMLEGWLPGDSVARIFLALLVFGAFFTVITNGDPLIYGRLFLPGLSVYDAFATILGYLMTLLPFFLARKYLAYPEHNRTLIVAFVVAGMCYSLLALYEVRMSPQLSRMIYGFFPHSWLQHIRGDGFRPIVFLQHGLWVSIFFTCTVLAAAGAARLSTQAERAKYYAACGWLLMTLFLTKSLGAFAIALLLLPCMILLRPRLQIIICAGFAMMVMIYPALRMSDFIPIDLAVSLAESINPDRAGSLQFRLDNEDLLLERARERPIFGWAGWGRSGVFDEMGRELTTPDGYWVISMGVGGWFRYIAEFGLLCMPIIMAALKARKMQLGTETSVLILMLTANLIDLVPNGTATPLTWMLAGVIWGRLELGRISERDAANNSDTAGEKPRDVRYTRFRPGHKTGSETGPKYVQ